MPGGAIHRERAFDRKHTFTITNEEQSMKAKIAILAFAGASALSLADTANATVGWENGGWQYQNTFGHYYGSGGQGIDYVMSDPPYVSAGLTLTSPLTASTFNRAYSYCVEDGGVYSFPAGNLAGPGYGGCTGVVGQATCESITPACPANQVWSEGIGYVYQNQ
jgi:hypothetical protein